jgi:hypothetical protein
VQQHGSLLVGRLDRHKAHRRPHNRLANRFGIGGIVLIALDVARAHVNAESMPGDSQNEALWNGRPPRRPAVESDKFDRSAGEVGRDLDLDGRDKPNRDGFNVIGRPLGRIAPPGPE